MGLFDSLGKIVSNVGSGIGSFVSTASNFAEKLNPLSQIATGISGLFDNKDSGNIGPQITSQTPLGAFSPPPVPVETTTGLGTGSSNPFGLGFFAPNNQGSGGSLVPRPPFENQNTAFETSQSSLGGIPAFFQSAPNIIGLGTQIAKRVTPFFGLGSGQTLKQPFDIPEIGEIIQPDDNRTFITDYDISKLTGDFMAYGVGGQGALTIPQAMPMQGSAFMSPVLGRIGISSKGNIIITRKLRNQFKALADNVGLAQASNLAGVPLEIGAMILTKRFPTRGKSISTKKMRDCARTYRQITNFYNMIPKRTATRKASTRSMRGASTVIQNS
jgi:hypothetical protein